MPIGVKPRVGWAVAGGSAGLVGLWLVLGVPGVLGSTGLREFLETEYLLVIWGLTCPVVGALILSRAPGNRIGWLYCGSGLACALSLASFAYAQRGLVDQPGSMPGALAAAWVSSWAWMCGFGLLMTLGVLGFPDGRLPSRRWWPVAALAGLTLGIGVASIAVRPGPLLNHPARDNPLGLPLVRWWYDSVLETAWLPLLTLAIVGSVAGLVVRYRSGSATEKDQLRWFMVASAFMVASFAIPAGSSVGFVGNLLIIVAAPLFPLSLGIAILRSRLADVAVPLRRSLVYCTLLAIGLVVYAGVILVLDAILRGHAQPLVALVGAGAVAVLYQPVRLRLQRAVDRMLYGDRGDPYAVSTNVGRRLETAGSAEEALSVSVAAIAESLRLPYVAIELPGDPPGQPTAMYGSMPRIGPVSISLRYGGDDVGRLVVGQRSAREPLNDSERRLLDDLGRQVAVTTHAALLGRALRRSFDRLVVTREEERLRLRRDLHDGVGPALAGVALGVDAARHVLRTDMDGADELLRDLKDETLGCVAEVRRIIDNLRPPALDELGLLPALVAFAERLSSRDGSLQVLVESPRPLADLPALVEVAAYRIATEAMTNVARHSGAHHCRLRLEIATADLTVAVWDDGIGLPAEPLPGVGLVSMSERAAALGGDFVIRPAEGGGTLALAHLPLAAA